MQVELVDSTGRLVALRPEWKRLWIESPEATPFQHPDWLLPWWAHFGSGELMTIAVWRESKLIGLAPLFLLPWNEKRQVTFLGNGVSDRLDFLMNDASALASILDGIAAQSHRWDICDLQDIREGSPLCELPVGTLEPQYICPVVALPDSVAQYEENLPHGLRRNLRRYHEHLDQAGEVRFETAGPDSLDRLMDQFFVLHRARWNEGMVPDLSTERFHREAMRNFAASGFLRLHSISVGDRAAAIVYAIWARGRTYSYLGGFDPELARFSPGALIMQYSIRCAIEEGCREWDFLRGQEAYKYDWGARDQRSFRLVLTSSK